MYTEYYGLREPPFQMTPNARLFFPSSVHSRAHAHLLFGLAQGEGFIVITGEVGAGKSTLVERLCAKLDPERYSVARIATTQVGADDLLRLVAGSFGVASDGSKAAMLQGVAAMLRAGPRHHLLIVDEAQGLSFPALEELRMLSNLTGDHGQPLLQIILLGQPQLRQTMSRPDLDQLRQRVLASYHLSGLSAEETAAYVEFRMRAVGWTGTPAWEQGALESVYQHSGGIPRRVNRLCSRVLLAGALEQAPVLTESLVETTALELNEDLGAGAEFLRDGPHVGDRDDLDRRLTALENSLARHERVLGQLGDLFGVPRRVAK